jgi:hypothetical protein
MSKRSLGSLLLCLASVLAMAFAWSPVAGAAVVIHAGPAKGGVLQDGTPVKVKMTSSGVSYTFTAVTNEHLTLAVTEPVTSPAGSCVQIVATDSSNNVDGSTEFSTQPADFNFTPTAAEAGKTTVTIEPDGYECTAATSATMTLTYATDVTGTLTSGETITTTVPNEGQNADFTFGGVAFHHVTVAVTNPLTSPDGSCLQIAAYNTSNYAYASTEFSTSPTDINFAPSETGLVTVVVSPDGYECTPASSSTFSLTYAKDVTGTLKSGVPVKVHLKYEGQNGAYTFAAVANQEVSLAVTNPVTSPPGSCMQLAVTDPSNYEEAQTEFGTQPTTLDFTPTPAEAGKTTVTVEADGYECTPASAGRLTLTYTAG